MQTAKTVLNVLKGKSRNNPEWRFQRLYRILYNTNLYQAAYANISSKEGNMTPGTDGETIDGFSMKWVEKLVAELKEERYYPKPVRRIYIPKKNGKMRPLGIPSVRDKLLQEVMRMILEAIYEPLFSDSSHAYRPQRSCHTALHQIKRSCRGTRWVIEGDIQGFYDNIDHTILLNLLKKKIDDSRFLELVRRFLRSGYMEFREVYDSLSGVPQGGIISPILANVYLHEFDCFMKQKELEHHKGRLRARNQEYTNLSVQRYEEYHYRGNIAKARRILKEMRKIPSQDFMDDNFTRLRYVRYADDFVVMIIGSKQLAEDVKACMSKFLHEELRLTLSDEKTKITNLGDENVRFLGYELSRADCDSALSLNSLGIKKRAFNGEIQLLVPSDVINERLKRYMRNGKSAHYSVLLNYPVPDIINTYNAEIRGLYYYYCLATDVSRKLGKFKFYHYYSMVKTIAHKERISVKKVIAKYGIDVPLKRGTGTRKVVGFRYETKDGEKVITYFNESLKKRDYPLKGETGELKIALPTKCQLLARLNANVCEMCGATDHPIQVHHIRKLKDVKRKYTKKGEPISEWALRMARIRRKTLAVCERCHRIIHSGGNTQKVSSKERLESRIH